jgi:hypothetical protein
MDIWQNHVMKPNDCKSVDYRKGPSHTKNIVILICMVISFLAYLLNSYTIKFFIINSQAIKSLIVNIF